MQQATNESDLEKTTSFLKKRKKELEERLASFNNEEALNTDLICQQAVDSWTAELEVIIEVLDKFSNGNMGKNHYPVYGVTDLRLLTEIKMKELNGFDTEKETVLRVSIKKDQIEMPFEGWLKQPFHMGQSNLGVKVPTPQDLVDYVTKPLLERIEVLEKKLAELIDITGGVIEANKELIDVLDKNKREKQSEF